MAKPKHQKLVHQQCIETQYIAEVDYFIK